MTAVTTSTDIVQPPHNAEGHAQDIPHSISMAKEFVRQHARILDSGSELTLKVESLISLLTEASELLCREPTVLAIDGGNIYVIGNIFGHYRALWKLLGIIGWPPSPQRKMLFLGNYTTRGRRGIEVLTLLVSMKLCWPDCVFLCRGHHDSASMAGAYGFKDVLQHRKLYNDSVWYWYTQLCNSLPLCAIVEGSVFCANGGLSRQLVPSDGLEKLAAIHRPIELGQAGGLVHELLWACPQQASGWAIDRDDHFSSAVFGPDIVNQFLDTHGLNMIVRSMQLVNDGVMCYPTERVVTVFSAPSFCGDFTNAAGMLRVSAVVGADADGKRVLQVKPVTYSTHSDEPDVAKDFPDEDSYSDSAHNGTNEATSL